MNWVQRKIYLYNVTFGLYMLDWWERYLFNTLVIVLMWFVFYNSSRYVTEFCKRLLRLIDSQDYKIKILVFPL
ncbi:uncharacterized protein LOC120182396 isoform X1 [Hibiscus syriacus]|uniref:uncharacterized protein LOC120182396 isoform X1 n=1 Tax=Hibiscus syriacus TaxID=106335 RepID=UPI001920F290|nr:uncharacterized protein LOC120182396 isoform X1 [Hibiscus syriacus]XP_039043317.1 uncharacterized protein LOC120182396 isoform X1 [Hibiscus syriacus]